MEKIELTKICTKCNTEKVTKDFHKNKAGRLGVGSWCKTCKSDYQKNHSSDYFRKYYIKHKEKKKAYSRNYLATHRDRVNIRKKERRKTDCKFKLNLNIGGAIRKSLTRGKNGYHWEDLVGYTIDDLKKYIEKKFTDGMTWALFLNGKIHIDHKIPINAFNFTKPEHGDFKRCWALSNLQPLWAKDNLEKHAKLDKHFQPSLLI